MTSRSTIEVGRADRDGRLAELVSMLTVVILTRDEVELIDGLLAHIPNGLRVVVVDSGSTDGTTDVAEKRGAAVVALPWQGFAAQRNAALGSDLVDTPWVLFVDADERVSTGFWRWAADTLSRARVEAFELPSVLVHTHKRLRHAPGYPILHPRLVRTTVRFVPNHEGHGESLPDGTSVAVAPEGYEHHYLYHGLSAWLDKHRRHAMAAVNAERDAVAQRGSTTRGRVSVRVPTGITRAFARFAYHFVLRRGFLDGRAGFEYSLLYGWFELTKALYKRSGDVGHEAIDAPGVGR